MQEHGLMGGKKKGRGGDDGMLGEEVQEIIDELKNDLRIRDMEFEELKASMAKLQAENAQLRQQHEKERNQRLVIEGKLKKTAIHNELKENAQAITNSTFFEQKRSKLASLNSTLLSTVSLLVMNFGRSTSNTSWACATPTWPSTRTGGCRSCGTANRRERPTPSSNFDQLSLI